MAIRSVAWRSIRFVLIGSVASWVVICVWPDLVPAVKTIGDGLFWSVAFVLATSLATFNNTLRIFDRIEEVVKHDLRDLSQEEQAYLHKTIRETETLTASLLGNSLIVILAGIMYFVVGAFFLVPSPRWLPSWIDLIRPDVAGVAVRFGLGLLATRILVVQFQAIPPMVAFYKFFTVDRHLLPDATGGEAGDTKKAAEESCCDS